MRPRSGGWHPSPLLGSRPGGPAGPAGGVLVGAGCFVGSSLSCVVGCAGANFLSRLGRNAVNHAPRGGR
eukprot:11724786-Alexandrium_andersonii.AAC.1